MISIDPGQHPAWAVFLGNYLRETDVYRNGSRTIQAAFGKQAADRIVIEEPRIWPRHPRPQDIVTLAIEAGRLLENALFTFLSPPVIWVPAPEWKGQVPKTDSKGRLLLHEKYIVHKRILDILTPGELTVYRHAIETLSNKPRFDVTDAVGLGLNNIGRYP